MIPPRSSSSTDVSGNLNSSCVTDDGSGTADGTNSSSPVGNNADAYIGTVFDGGSGATEGSKLSLIVDIDTGGNLSRGPVVEAAVNLCSGTLLMKVQVCHHCW